jgi:electron transfer flavoprotein alpha subunit
MSGTHVLTFVENDGGHARRPSLEALGEARRIAAASGGAVDAVVLGPGARALGASLTGVRKVFYEESALFVAFHLAEAAGAVLEAVKASGAGVVVMSATSLGRELAPAVAADLKTCVGADVTETAWTAEGLTILRPIYAGKALLRARFRRLPAVITLRPSVFAPDDSGSGAPAEQALTPPREDARARVVETIEPQVVRQDLSEAETIVSGGRGLRGPENFGILESLAKTLHGVVGASRAVCDAGWRPHSDQVGQTGKTVSPRLYIACGISGAIQHLAGMSGSKNIVAINKDPNAPIFQVADYGIVGDLFEVVPALEAEIKKTTGR